MVLSGNIKEFILADVFNLLSQQKITGRLVLTDGKIEGGIVFKEGVIVGADCGDENLANKLFNYMTGVKNIHPGQVNTLFNASAGNLSALATTITERNAMGSRELKNFTESCVEDICCSLLAWYQGTYRFNSLRNMGQHACGTVTIPVESIIMEGMRRADEWSRMKEYIGDDMIFAPTKSGGGQPTEFDVIGAPVEYIFSLLDGNNTVKGIKKSCCLCEYKVYESINILLQEQRITATNQKHAQPIQAALQRKNAEEAAARGKNFFGSLLSVGVAAAFVLFFLFCKTSILPKIFEKADTNDNSAIASDATLSETFLNKAINAQ